MLISFLNCFELECETIVTVFHSVFHKVLWASRCIHPPPAAYASEIPYTRDIPGPMVCSTGRGFRGSTSSRPHTYEEVIEKTGPCTSQQQMVGGQETRSVQIGTVVHTGYKEISPPEGAVSVLGRFQDPTG